MISVAGQLGLRMVALDHDDDGLLVDTLAARHDQQPFDLLYVMPEHQNPTTARLAEDRRAALVAFARERDLWIVEDGVEHLAAEQRGTPLFQRAPERTTFCFRFPRFYPAGCAPVSCAYRRACASVATVVRNVSWMPPPLIALIVGRRISSGDADCQLARQFEELEARRPRSRMLAEFSPRTRAGGFYAWLPLPPGQRASRVVERLAESRIRVNAAEAFCVGSEAAPQAIRLCFSAARDRAALADALATLREVLDSPAPSPWQTI